MGKEKSTLADVVNLLDVEVSNNTLNEQSYCNTFYYYLQHLTFPYKFTKKVKM